MANGHMKRCSTSLLEKCKSKTTMRYHLTPDNTAIIKTSIHNKCWRGRGKGEPSYAVHENVNWYSPLWSVLKKLKIELPYDPAIPFLGIYLEKDENPNLKRYMYPNVHSSTIYNSQDMETIQVLINRQLA